MTVTDADQARVIALLGHDVAATLGPGYDGVIQHAATVVRTFSDDPDDYVDNVVEYVQQELHDLLIDTTWPQCPVHRRHPLSLHDGDWLCEQDRVRAAPPGQRPAHGSSGIVGDRAPAR